MGSSARARSRWTRRWAVTRAFAVVAFAAASEGGVSGAPFANGGALRAAVQNCLAVDPTGGCDCANATVDCGAAGSDPMELWDVSAVTDISFMFSGATSFNQPIGNWNVSAVTDMSGLFSGATSFNQPIGNWNVSAVTSMNNMFEDARSFNQPIGNWNVSAVTDISFMFANARSFNQPIGNWNVSAVTGMYSMFRGATSFNQPIGSWNVSAVTNMAYIFANASSFDQPIGAWNTASVRIMDDMFTLAKSFDQPIGGWNTRNVVTMRRMFSYASKFNQDISTWNVSNVRSTRAMFALASRFDQDITVWDSPLLLSNETFAMFHCANAWLATHKRSDGSLHTTGPPSAWTMSAGAWTGSTCGDVQSDASNDINVTFHVSGPFTTEDASAGDRVGQRMSTSGNVTLVGYARDDVTSTSRGAAYIFERNVAGWTQTHKLTPSNASQFEDFGVYVKLSGETAFIWSTPNLSYAPRCIHVFRRIGSTWTETQILTVPADLELEAERFELTTTHAFVRARAYSDPRRRQRMIIVYKVLSNGTWVYDTRIPLEVTNFWSEGSFIRVPPPGYYYIQKAENDRLFMTMSHMRGGVEGRGFVFKYSGSSWILEAELPLIGLYSWCPSGAFTGSIVLIGCNALRYNIGVDSEARGVVYVYERNESNWYLTASIEPPDATQYFGGTIDISGEYALIGDPRSRPYGDSQGNRGADAGVVYVFQRINAFTWVEKTRIYANDAAPSDLFGDSQPNYAFTGSRAMVGAGGHGANGQDSGAFYEVNFEFKPVAAASEGGVSGAPFANGGALRTAVQNCLAVDPTGGCDCANATVDCGAAGSDPMELWDVSAVDDMYQLFRGAQSFNQPIGNWNVSAVTDISFMFANARSFNQPIGNWNVSAVTNMAYTFASASSFDQPIGAWNTASVRIMDDMFTLAKSFDQPIGGWNTRNVVTMRRMFSYASKFNQDISTWNVSNVRSTRAMFASASRFDQDITVWDSPLLLSNETFAMFHCANAWLATHKRSDGSLHTTGPPSAWTMSAGAWTGSTCGDVQSDASNDINVTFHVSGPFTTEDASAGDRVGQRMSTSGNVTLVGYARDDVTSTSRGAAYIFERNVAGWTQTHKLTPSNASQFEDFGVYVKLSGETAFIGSTGSKSSIHVFRRIGSTWTETQILTVPADVDLTSSQRFELTATRAFIHGRDAQRRWQRMIIVYKVLSNGTWVYDTRIPLEVTNFWPGYHNRAPAPGYYRMQKAENDRLFVTMYKGSIYHGAEDRAFVFKYSGSSWTLEAELPSIGPYSMCRRGAFTGSIVLISCEDQLYMDIYSARGAVYVYERNESNWYLTASIEPPDATQYFGRTIDISGEYALIGDTRTHPYGDSQGNRGADAGVVYVFQRINAFTWVEKTRIYANDAAPSDLFGYSQPNYAFTGSRAMVGAGGHGANGQDSGAFYEVNFEFKPVTNTSSGTSGVTNTSSGTSGDTNTSSGTSGGLFDLFSSGTSSRVRPIAVVACALLLASTLA